MSENETPMRGRNNFILKLMLLPLFELFLKILAWLLNVLKSY